MVGLGVLAAVAALAGLISLLLAWRKGRFSRPSDGESREHVDVAALGVAAGDRATLVQFSSAFCAPCRTTRVILAEVETLVPGVSVADVDAESHLELVRELHILRTPTVLILDAEGFVVTRASGAPTRDQVLATLAAHL